MTLNSSDVTKALTNRMRGVIIYSHKNEAPCGKSIRISESRLMGQVFINNKVETNVDESIPGKEPLQFHRRLPDYMVTPLISAEKLASRLGVSKIWVKDESDRFGLPAFKILGASWAFYRAIQDHLNSTVEPWNTLEQLKKKTESLLPLKLVTATDGNHGRGVARVASWFGLKSKIVMPQGTERARIKAIESEGAAVILVDGDYDQAVTAAAHEQSPRTWLIQDTAWPGYETIPRWIIEGYSTMFWEIQEQLNGLNEPEPNVVLVQIGVGSLAAAVVQFYKGKEKTSTPRIIGVEPEGAACAFESAKTGHRVSTPGPHPSVMAGLNCGTVSTVAWPLLRDGIDAFVVTDNERAFEAMRLLAEDGFISGESGAAGAAGLLEIFEQDSGESLRRRLGINASSRVLLISTEGATDPLLYQRVVGILH